MDRIDRTTAVGVFDRREQAEAAIVELRQAGFRLENLGVLARSPPESETEPGRSVAAGTIGGASLGALAGIAVLAGAIPPLGPVIAGGALAGLLASTVAGAAVGGIVGGLYELGVPEEEGRFYEAELAAGGHLIPARAGGRYEEAVAIIRRHGGRDWTNRRPVQEPVPVPVF